MARRRRTDTEQTAVFEVSESFSTDLDGAPLTLARGQLVAADHPALPLHPQYFRPAASAAVATEPQVFRADPSQQPAPPSKPKPRLVRAKRTITVDGILLGGGWVTEGRTVIFEGQEIAETHPAYAANKSAFEKVKA